MMISPSTCLLLLLALPLLVRGKDDLGKKGRGMCTLALLESEGDRKYRAAHLQGHFLIPRFCQTLSFYEYWKDERVSRRVREMPIRELLTYITAALKMGGKFLGGIEVVHFGHCRIHDRDIPMLLKIFDGDNDWRSLQEIHLNGNHLTDEGVKHFIGGLEKGRKRLSGMRELHLDNNQIGHEGMKAVVDYARNYHGFKHLHLSHNSAWSTSQNDKLGDVLKWMPITEKSNVLSGHTKKYELQVHVGGRSTIRRLVDAATAADNKKGGDSRINARLESAARAGLFKSQAWIDDVSRLEFTLLGRGLPGTRTVLSDEHIAAIRTLSSSSSASDFVTEEEERALTLTTWEEESEVVMNAFVEGCIQDPSSLSGPGRRHSHKDITDRLYLLGYPTPSMLVQVDPEDLKQHLRQAPDVLVKALLRCVCEYYPHFIYLAEVRARAATEGQVTLSDLLDDPRAMHMNMQKGPLFKRTKQSVRYAGSQIHNLGTGGPHKTWLPYKHADHHLTNIEPSLHERMLSREATLSRASRDPESSSTVDFSGMAGIQEDYRDAWKEAKYVTYDVRWHRSFCASPYFKRARGAAASTGQRNAGVKTKTKRRDRNGKIVRDEL